MTEDNRAAADLALVHLRFGWCALLSFVLLGMVLEGMHAFKVGSYLDVGQETRRLMWRLAHAHGTLLGLVNLALAFSLPKLRWSARQREVASTGMRACTVLLPLGFFLGGVHFHESDPGVGVLLVPVGGLMLLVSVALIARASLTR